MAKDLTVSAAMRLYTCYVRPTLEIRVYIACVAWLTDRLGLVSTGTHPMLSCENSAQSCLGHTERRDSSKTHPAIPSVAKGNTFNGVGFLNF